MTAHGHTGDDTTGPWGEVFYDPGHPGADEPCACGCSHDVHVGEIGCPCGLPDEPPCTPAALPRCCGPAHTFRTVRGAAQPTEETDHA